MSNSTKFKGPEPLSRTLLTETSYMMGMNYTDAPIIEGSARQLINYDIKSNKAPLIPRPGIRTTAIAVHPIKRIDGVPLAYTNETSLQSSKYCAEGSLGYTQAIIADLTDFVQDPVSELVKGVAYVYTVLPEGETAELEHPESFGGYSTKEIHYEDLRRPEIDPQDPILSYCYFRQPPNLGIHGMPVEDTAYNSSHIGTWAFGNRWWFFRHVVEGEQLLKTQYDEVKGYYVPEVIVPKALTPKEAVLWGYNMLSDKPYDFENTTGVGVIQLNGVLPYDAAGVNLEMSPRVNQDMMLKCFYTAPTGTSYKFKWEWKTPDATTWELMGEELVDTGALADATHLHSFPTAQIMIRITCTVAGSPDDIIQSMVVGYNFDKNSYGSTTNAEPTEYTIAKSKGLVHWNNRLCCYAPPEGKNTMFFSEINDPSYFPYPNNAEIFNEDILFAIPLMSNLLVFTTTELYVMVGSADGLSWNKQLIQSNLNLQEQDIHLIQVVKNMLFFKSDNYYYMIVPSMKTASALAVVPVSDNVKGLLDGFGAGVAEALLALYNVTDTFTLVQYYNYLDYEDVHNVYLFRTAGGLLFNFVLMYNTMSRGWRTYIYQVPHTCKAYRPDATTRGELIAITALEQRYLVDDVITTRTTACIQFLHYDSINLTDVHIPSGIRYAPALSEVLLDDSDDPAAEFADINTFRNYQLLDTGNREHVTTIKKRYRELQLTLNNVGKIALRFYTDFYLDGGMRKGKYTYTTHHDVDPLSPTYGLLYVERILLDPDLIPVVAGPGITTLAEDEAETEYWTLDNAMFPDITFWKIRIPVTGKGYTPKMVLVSMNESRYELLTNSWVYKGMYAR